MLRIVRCSFFAVLVSMLMIGIQAFAAAAAVPYKALAQRPAVKPRASMSAKAPRTPYERIFAPGLARSLKAAGGGSGRERVRPAARAATPEEPSANFAGYPAGSLFATCPL
jgi:hypothetical protein